MGLGGVVHTLNPRLSDKDLTFIANDARDLLLFSDITFVPQLARILPHIPSIKASPFVLLKHDLMVLAWENAACCLVRCTYPACRAQPLLAPAAAAYWDCVCT